MGLIGIPRSLRDDIDFLKVNMPLIVLRQVVDAGWSVLKMIDGIADEFTDTTGIGSLGGATHDVSGKYLHNPGGTALVAYSAGTVISDASARASNAFDGTTSQTSPSCATKTATSLYLGKDWGAGSAKTITRFTIYGMGDGTGFCWGSSSSITIKLQGSSDGSAWGDLYSTTVGDDTLGNPAVIDVSSGINTSAAYRYHRVLWSSGSSETWYVAEVTFYEITSPANVTAVSTAFTADAQPSEARLVVRHQAVDALTVNTDFLTDVSRDGGVTWSTVPLVLDGPADASSNVYSGVVSLSGQPAGTAMKYRLRTANTKTQRMHGVWLQWKV